MNYVHQELSAFNLISLVENVYRTWRTCMLITCMLIPIFNFKFGRICVQIHAVFSSILLSRLHSSCDSYSCLLGIDVCLDWYFYLFLNPCFSLCCLCIYILYLCAHDAYMCLYLHSPFICICIHVCICICVYIHIYVLCLYYDSIILMFVFISECVFVFLI